MANPTYTFDPVTNNLNVSRHARIGFHETADGDFVNASPGSPLPVDVKQSSSTSTVNAGVALSGDTAEVAAVVNANRKYIAISVDDKAAFIRLMPAATDNAERKGIYVGKGQTYEFPASFIYTGEISIINAVGGQTPTFYVTEY